MYKLLVLLSTLTVAFAADVRLVDSDGNVNNLQGRVEVRLSGNWGQVCGDGFSSVDAGVVCRELGYDGNGGLETGQHGIGKFDIVIGQVSCSGSESSILNCPYSKQSTCQTNIAAVNCQTPLTTTGSIGEAAGIIAAIVICLVAIVGVIILLGACLWRNDFCIGGRSLA